MSADPRVRGTTVDRGAGATADQLAVEEPLEIRVDGKPLAVLMRSPGDDLDLAAGFLATEGVIDGLDDLTGLAHCLDPARPNRKNVVLCQLAAGARADPGRFERARRDSFSSSSCGLCGKASIDRVFLDAPQRRQKIALPASVVCKLPRLLRAQQPAFDQTGGLHAAALVSLDGALVVAREDIGRHNAVDKVLGAQLRADRWPLEDLVLVVSSRAGFEIVQKASMAGIAGVVACGAATTLAVDLAQRAQIALFSFVRGDRFNRHP